MLPSPTRFPNVHQPLVQVENLSVRYGETSALERANFHLCAKEFVAVIGPNGAGKSTLLKTMLGLSQASLGSVSYSPSLGPKPIQSISYVPQQQSLDWNFPLSAFELVLMGRTRQIGWFKRHSATDTDRVRAALVTTQLESVAQRPISALSGGQKQRLLLARMLVKDSKLLFLDEPFGGVDTQTQEVIYELLERERLGGKALLMVTHDVQSAARWCSHLLLVNRTVIASGKPAEVYTPENVQATFSGLNTTGQEPNLTNGFPLRTLKGH